MVISRELRFHRNYDFTGSLISPEKWLSKKCDMPGIETQTSYFPNYCGSQLYAWFRLKVGTATESLGSTADFRPFSSRSLARDELCSPLLVDFEQEVQATQVLLYCRIYSDIALRIAATSKKRQFFDHDSVIPYLSSYSFPRHWTLTTKLLGAKYQILSFCNTGFTSPTNSPLNLYTQCQSVTSSPL